MLQFLNFSSLYLPQDYADVVICGSGIAGLVCAIKLKDLGITPVILTRGIGNTYYSQGGIACAIDPKDSPYKHLLDTLKSGKGLCDSWAVKVLVEEGIQRVVDLKSWGFQFDEESTIEGGHSFPRVLKVKDYTGKAVYEFLFDKVKALNIPIIFGSLEELLIDESIEGLIYSTQKGLRLIKTKAVVLATGGAASIFLHTSNPSIVRGDGIGLGFRFGCYLRDPEFVQFHPTVVENSNILISEAVRGEGAILVDEKGERFVDELETRDTVTKAIYKKLSNGGKVYISFKPVISKGVNLQARFPTIYSMLKERGYDPEKNLIPVVPAAHYYIGGINTDLWGRTSLEGLYAIGECSSTGVHGANRLASNSLLEGLVFGYRCAYRIYEDIKTKKISNKEWKNTQEEKTEPPYTIQDLKKLMWEKVGIQRNEESLKEAKNCLLDWIKGYKHWTKTPQNRLLLDVTLVAVATTVAALERKESRGAHYRADFPNEREEFRFNTKLSLNSVGL